MPALWDTSRRHMITHTSDPHQIPSQNKTTPQILRNCQKFKFSKKLYTWHTIWSCSVYKMYKYDMDPTRTVGGTERTRDAGWTDGVKPIYPPRTLLCGGITTTTQRQLKHQIFSSKQLIMYFWWNHPGAWCQPTPLESSIQALTRE